MLPTQTICDHVALRSVSKEQYPEILTKTQPLVGTFLQYGSVGVADFTAA